MLSHKLHPCPISPSHPKVFSLSSQSRWRLSGRHLLVFVALVSLSLHLSSLMAKNEANPVMWNPPVEPPGAVIVTRNSFEPPGFVAREHGTLQLAAVPSVVLDHGSKPLLQMTDAKANSVRSEQPKEPVAEDIQIALSQWSDAWRKQDMGRYLAAYAPSFAPAKGTSREAWAKQRTARITAKKNIRHEVRDVSVQIAQNKAIVKFTQIYADERLQQTDQKTMHWVLSDGRWLIAREVTQ